MVDQTKLEESRERVEKMSRQLKEAHSDVQDKEQNLVELIEKLKFNEKEMQDQEKYIAELKLTVNHAETRRVRSFNVARRVYEMFERRFMTRESQH